MTPAMQELNRLLGELGVEAKECRACRPYAGVRHRYVYDSCADFAVEEACPTCNGTGLDLDEITEKVEAKYPHGRYRVNGGDWFIHPHDAGGNAVELDWSRVTEHQSLPDLLSEIRALAGQA